jgi:hypothetical protein
MIEMRCPITNHTVCLRDYVECYSDLGDLYLNNITQIIDGGISKDAIQNIESIFTNTEDFIDLKFGSTYKTVRLCSKDFKYESGKYKTIQDALNSGLVRYHWTPPFGYIPLEQYLRENSTVKILSSFSEIGLGHTFLRKTVFDGWIIHNQLIQ